MKPIILYRDCLTDKTEREAILKYFPNSTSQRSLIKENQLVIGRYSVLPFYKELEEDINVVGSKLLNTYKQHKYIADIGEWYRDLEEITPKTWYQLDQIDEEGPYILKGATNSKKFLWDTHFFAKDKKEAIEVHGKLMDDTMIADQHIYIRKFVPLHTYLIGLRNMPITKEFRVFVCYGQVVCGGYYWSNYYDDIVDKPDWKEIPREFLEKVIHSIGYNANAYAVDIAQTQEGNWIVIEINDLQMSGLSMIEPEDFYRELHEIVRED